MFENCKDEVARAYRVLDADQAEMQNHRDIKQWKQDGYINAEEEKELHILNFRLCRSYR